MVQVFGVNFSCDQGVRVRLALSLETSQIQTRRVSTVSTEYQVSSGSSGHRSSQCRMVPSNYPLSAAVQRPPLPSEDHGPLHPLQRTMADTPTMSFNDYLKLHNQTATPVPFGQGNNFAHASAHGMIPNPSAAAAGYSPPAHQRYSHTRTWSNATSSGTTAMPRGDNSGDNWPYHPSSFTSGPPGESATCGDQGAAHASDFQTHQNYESPPQAEETAPSPTTSSHNCQTWEQLVRELGLPV